MARFSLRGRQDTPKTKGSIGIKGILYGFLFTLIATLIISAAIALVLALTTLTETGVSGATYYLALLTVALGGAFGARRAPAMGWLHGALVGVLYALVIGLVGGVVFPGGLIAADLGRRILVAAAAGAIGGIIGVNV